MENKSKRYKIEKTSPHTYLDNQGNVVNGTKVDFLLTEYNEYHSINVPTFDALIIKAHIEALLEQRDLLA